MGDRAPVERGRSGHQYDKIACETKAFVDASGELMARLMISGPVLADPR